MVNSIPERLGRGSVSGLPVNQARISRDEIIALDDPELPRLDASLLPGWAGEFARAVSEATETPLELAVGMVLAACATATARRFRVHVHDGYSEPTNLWMLVALPPGNRKSSVQAAVTAPLLAWERDKGGEMEPEIRQIASEAQNVEARIKSLRARAAKEDDGAKRQRLCDEIDGMRIPEVPVRPQLWTSDATPERLGSMLTDHGECMAWLSSEGGIFDLLAGRYSSGVPNLDLALKAHSGDAERVDRGSRPPVYLESPRLTIGLSPQPSVLHGLANQRGFRGRGLLARFLYLIPPSPLGYRDLMHKTVAHAVESAYHAGLRAMLDLEPTYDEKGRERPHAVRLSAEARKEWREFAQSVEIEMRPGESVEYFTDWAGKAPGAAVRIAGVLHGIEHAHGRPWEHEISPETMGAALGITATITRHSVSAFGQMGADKAVEDAKKVWRWIESRRMEQCTVRDIYVGLKGSFPRVEGINKALDVLVERGYVEIFHPERDGPGRPPSPIVRVSEPIREDWQ